jgi:hypothetical protein
MASMTGPTFICADCGAAVGREKLRAWLMEIEHDRQAVAVEAQGDAEPA